MIAPLTNYKLQVLWAQEKGNSCSQIPIYHPLPIKSGNAPGINISPSQLNSANLPMALDIRVRCYSETTGQVLDLENTGIVVTTDLVRNTTDITLYVKIAVGDRLAAWALQKLIT